MRSWITRLFDRFGGDASGADVGPADGATMDAGAGKTINADQLVAMAMSTSADEIGCDEFFEQMDRFVELGLDGEDVAALMPLMQDHLDRCGDCREEYEALQRALLAVT